MGWGDWYPWASVADPANEGANFVHSVWYGSGNPSDIIAYLDQAQSLGVKVTLQIPQDAITADDQDRIRSWATNFGNHPGLYGWDTADEPGGDANTVYLLERAYNTLKSECSKPVSITFSPGAYIYGYTYALRNAYDLLIQVNYPHYQGQSEFAGCADRGKRWTGYGKAASEQVGKPYWIMGQAFNGLGENWRLPGYNEKRFCVYWAVLQGAEGQVQWIRYRNQMSVAQPGEVYPHGGPQWIEDVFSPLMAEFATFGPAFANGVLSDTVSSDREDVVAEIFRDDDGKHYLIAANSDYGSELTRFVLDLPFEPRWAIPTHDEGGPIAIQEVAGEYFFYDMFSDFQVHTYLVPAMIPGDANGDGLVSADDYASVQANFGDTGDPGIPGDANGTGTVSADDYASVQSNFGNTSGLGGDVTVPEPASAGLLLLGFSGLLWRRMKR